MKSNPDFGTSTTRREHINNWLAWKSKRSNRIRLALASWIFTKEGWSRFSAAYLEVRVYYIVKGIERNAPKTWEDAVRMIPSNIDVINKRI